MAFGQRITTNRKNTGSANRRKKRKDQALSEAGHLYCQRLCTDFIKEVADKKLTFVDEEVITLLDEYEAKWHKWVRLKVKKPSLATRKMFTSKLQVLVDANEKRIQKKNDDTTS